MPAFLQARLEHASSSTLAPAVICIAHNSFNGTGMALCYIHGLQGPASIHFYFHLSNRNRLASHGVPDGIRRDR
jgi:hypothetical protein